MTKCGVGSVTIAAWMFLLSQESHGAQDGYVSAEGTRIFQGPSATSPEIGQAAKGQALRMSDVPRDGFYRVVVPGTRQIGYVFQSDVAPRGSSVPAQPAEESPGLPPPPPRAQADESTEPYGSRVQSKSKDRERSNAQKPVGHGTYVWVFGAMHRYGGLDTSAVGGTAKSTTITAPAFGAELGIQVGESWWVAPQLSTLKFESTDQVYTAKSTIFSVLANIEVARSGAAWLGIGLGPGMGFGSKITASLAGTTVSSDSFSAPAFVSRVQGKYFLNSSFALGLDLGYRYLAKSGVPVTAGTSVDVNLSSFNFGAGLHLSF